MARNEEKGHAMLNKWVTMKKSLSDKDKGDRRPFLATECGVLQDAEKWRREIIRETSKKVSDIQNAGLGEHKIRDLNDAINKLLRERTHWEKRIIELGGPNYLLKSAVKTLDADGKELPGGGGYKYFGAARDLPGVRELFQKSEAEAPRRTRGDMFKRITPDYYGYRDDEDGVLAPKEAAASAEAIAMEVKRWEEERAARKARGEREAIGVEDDDEDVLATVEAEMLAKSAQASAVSDANVTAHVPVVSQESVEAAILAKKKKALLAKYAE